MARGLLLLVALLLSSRAWGISLRLDQASSDSTPASLLQGAIEFEVEDEILIVTVVNETTGPSAFSIYGVLFNMSSDVQSIELEDVYPGYYGSPGQWTPYDSGYYVSALGFGTFDYSLWQWSHEPIGPGERYAFEFEIYCAAGKTCDADDFGTQLSAAQGGTPALAAARWGDGPNLDAAFSAAIVSEPAVLWLLALAMPALALRRRRQPRSG